jgi:GT2 family glycosyltransferase
MIYIIIPVYNRIKKTINCLNSILDQNRKDIQIIIVNDKSTDNTEYVIKENYPKVTLLYGTGSLFWTGAIELGVNYVLKICSNKDWILIANNDVEFRNDCIDKLIKFSENKNRKVIASALSVDIKDKNTIIKSGTIVRSWFLNWNHQILDKLKISNLNSKKEIEANLLTGRCLLHPVEVFARIGNYNSKMLPHYGGDDEFTARAKSAGYKLFVLPSSVVFLDQDNSYKKKESFVREMFISIKSGTNLIYRWRLARMIAPLYALPSFFFISILKSIIQYLRNK